MEVNTIESHIKHLDSLQDTSDFVGSEKILTQALAEHPTHVELLWRMARCCYQLGEEVADTDTEQKEKIYKKGLEYATKAIESDPNHWGGYKWSGILVSVLDFTKTANERIANAYTIRDFFIKAESLSPADPTTKLCLGKWCFTVANISWIARNAAALIYSTLPESTLEEALTYFQAAEKLILENPSFKANENQTYLMLGKTYQSLKKSDEAKNYFQKCIDAPVFTTTDRKGVEEAKAGLKSLSSWW